jgi:hypothetical protein
VNFAGRIEAGRDLTIGAQYLTNMAYNGVIDPAKPEYRILWLHIRGEACSWRCNWTELGRDYIDPTSINLSSTEAVLKVGNDIIISSLWALNQSSFISAGHDVAIKTNLLQNLTYSEVANLRKRMQMRNVKIKKLKVAHVRSTEEWIYQQRFYSATRAGRGLWERSGTTILRIRKARSTPPRSST